MFMYTVKKGDSLYSIARKYNTTVQEIINLNNLKSNVLQIGQVLRIPEMYTPENEMTAPNFTSYTVKKGDTLYSIAKSNGISVDTIIKDNALTNNNLSIGQTLKLRISDDIVEECFGVDYTPPEEEISTITYTVKKGDNLYSIANRYSTSVSTIMNLNNLKSINLSIGQQLKIPSSTNTSTTTYVVKSGDNLYAIARKFNTTVDTIKKKNNLTSNLLSIGQKLII